MENDVKTYLDDTVELIEHMLGEQQKEKDDLECINVFQSEQLVEKNCLVDELRDALSSALDENALLCYLNAQK